MDLGLKGRTALVLGGSRGLGRAVAADLVAEGVQVVIVARNGDCLNAVATQIGAKALVADLSRPGESHAAVTRAAEIFGRGPDILVTNTGGPLPGTFDQVSQVAWQNGFDSLWMSFVESVKAALPGMRDRNWGRIIAITSIAAKEPQAGLIVSNGLRAGLLGLVNALSREVAGSGITVNALMPGNIRTDRLVELGVDEQSVGATIPTGRLGRPEEFAAVAAFLASDRASFVTGQAIAVDGGMLRAI